MNRDINLSSSTHNDPWNMMAGSWKTNLAFLCPCQFSEVNLLLKFPGGEFLSDVFFLPNLSNFQEILLNFPRFFSQLTATLN